jgi:hypothetical protein
MNNVPVSVTNELDKKGYLIIKRVEFDRLQKVTDLLPEVINFALSLNNKLNKTNIKNLDKWHLISLIEDDLISLVISQNEKGHGKEG